MAARYIVAAIVLVISILFFTRSPKLDIFRYLQEHSYLGPFSIAAVAFLAAVVAFISYLSTVRWNFARYLADRYFEIFRLAVTKPVFMEPSRTRRYVEEWPLGHPERPAYEAYARLCWSHAWDIWSARFLKFFFRKKFILLYANAFETYKRIHGKWLENNETIFPSKRFRRFIRKCKWRDYFDPHTADRLRWNNEVEDFDEKILHPLRIEQNNPLLEYVNQLANKETMVVADVGCGNGSFIQKLALHPFGKIYGVDYSDNMLELAKTKCRGLGNVEVLRLDMLDLSKLYGRCNIVFSLNSILPRDPRDTAPMLRELFRVLKPGGRLVAILPSFDTVVDLKTVELEMFIERRRERLPNAPRIIVRLLGRFDRWRVFHFEKRMSGWVDNTLGRFALCRRIALYFGVILGRRLFADDGINIQRLIHGDEIKGLIDSCGLRPEKQELFNYSWELATTYGYGHFAPDKYTSAKANQVYDWFVVARKPERAE